MIPSLLITFREAVEAVLIIGIVITFLTKTNQHIYKKFVWQGAVIGLGASILIAGLLELFFGGFTGRTEAIFEGILMFVTAGFITLMIMWVHRQKDVIKNIKNKISRHINKGYGFGITVLIASSVMREGTETVLYLKASSLIGQSGQLTGALIGIILALILGYALFKYALKINLSLIFNITSIFLILFAAGLVAHGIHEFQEINLLPVFSFDPVFNISHILDHKSVIGSFLRILFGYTSKPTILEIISYSVYIASILLIQKYSKAPAVRKI